MSRLILVLVAALAVSLVAAPAAEAAKSPYRQKIDNSSNRFSASGNWKTSSWSEQKFGRNYRYAKPGRSARDSASFRVRVPETKKYDVFARWPATRGYNASTAFGVRTTSGVEWKRVNQTRNGGKWVRLGTFRLKAGDSKKVYVSRGSRGKGYVIADAVMVKEAGVKKKRGSGLTQRGKVMREARSWLGTPYRYGGTARSGIDCSGLTMRIFQSVNMTLPRTVAGQYRLGSPTRSPRVGDLAFSNYGDGYGGSGRVRHVGVYAGNGKTINAPYPGTVVRYDPVRPYAHVGYRKLLR